MCDDEGDGPTMNDDGHDNGNKGNDRATFLMHDEPNSSR